MNDTERYEIYIKEKEREYESICRRCGECCGSKQDDPCRQLRKQEDGTYMCRVYADRLGAQETVKGAKFQCIPIQTALQFSDYLNECSYRKAGREIYSRPVGAG